MLAISTISSFDRVKSNTWNNAYININTVYFINYDMVNLNIHLLKISMENHSLYNYTLFDACRYTKIGRHGLIPPRGMFIANSDTNQTISKIVDVPRYQV